VFHTTNARSWMAIHGPVMTSGIESGSETEPSSLHRSTLSTYYASLLQYVSLSNKDNPSFPPETPSLLVILLFSHIEDDCWKIGRPISSKRLIKNTSLIVRSYGSAASSRIRSSLASGRPPCHFCRLVFSCLMRALRAFRASLILALPSSSCLGVEGGSWSVFFFRWRGIQLVPFY
jgi:hypothetical protein